MLTPRTPFVIVCNAAAGSSDAHEALTQMEEILSAASREHEFFLVEDPKELANVAQRAAEAARQRGAAVIAAGGDGTINTVAHATLRTGRPFGIIPQGTFNYSSRAHGIPSDTGQATQALLSARIEPIQVGVVNERIFLVNASLGLYPQLLEDREDFTRRYGRYRAVAVWSGLTTLAHWRRQLVLEIDHDNQREIVHTPTLLVGNNPLQLERVGLPEAEAVQHRKLAAVVVQPIGAVAMLGLAFRGALGQLGEASGVRNFAFLNLTVRPVRGGARGKLKVATDGEIHWLEPPLRFGVAPQSLMLMVPSGEQAPPATS